MSFSSSSTVWFGLTVMTSLMMTASARLTLRAMATSSLALQFLCRTPMAPSLARAMAISASVTVSMGVFTSASPGSTLVHPGRRRTSLKVRAFSAFSNF